MTRRRPSGGRLELKTAAKKDRLEATRHLDSDWVLGAMAAVSYMLLR